RDAVPVLDARRAEVDVVPGVRFLDADMVRDAQPFLVRLGLHHLHDVAVDAEQLDAVGAHRLDGAHAGDRRVGVGRATELWIDENARCDEGPVGARLAPSERLLRVAADVAYGGDAAGEPDVELVLDRLRNAAAFVLQMCVRVDETGQHVLARRVNLDGAGVGARTPAGAPARRHRIERHDLRDGVALDDDVERTFGRRTVAVDDGRVANDQPRGANAVGWRGLGAADVAI